MFDIVKLLANAYYFPSGNNMYCNHCKQFVLQSIQNIQISKVSILILHYVTGLKNFQKQIYTFCFLNKNKSKYYVLSKIGMQNLSILSLRWSKIVTLRCVPLLYCCCICFAFLLIKSISMVLLVFFKYDQTLAVH